ncbi:MAG: hypothetical protein WKF96_01345 [Solirubrobacteraceae bacterium]
MSAIAIGANQGMFARARVPKTGTLQDLCIAIVTPAGNISVAVYTIGATTWTRVYTTGIIVCPAASGWANVGNPAVAVTKGDEIMFGVSTDSASTGFGRAMPLSSGDFYTLPTGLLSNTPKMGGLDNSLHPMPATVTAAGPSALGSVPGVLARVV